MNTYVFNPSWQKERGRLQALESLFDNHSTRCLADLGVEEGWRCLEVGFGAGSVALWLAGQVGSTGRVVAVDLDTHFLDGHGRANLDVRQHDIVTGTMEDGSFDLAHARAVLEHIPDRPRALERMIAAVRPGGWLVLEDVDFGGLMAATLAHYADPPGNAPLMERIYRAVEAVFTAAGADASFGARHIRTLKDAGLENITAEVHTPVVAGGTENWVPGTIEHLTAHMVGTGLVTDADIASWLALAADPSCHYAPPSMVTTVAQRPAT